MGIIELGRVVGKSAYEIAVEKGFAGTETQWLNSLKGDGGAGGGIERKDLLKANPPLPLDIKTYAGGADQPTHPKVLHFPNGWNGYQYWMAYTPYPNNNAFEENPCIAASNNGYDWEAPNGLANPIDKIEEVDRGNYYSDTHLVYVPDTNTMECWYRKSIEKTNDSLYGNEIIYRKTTQNGTAWGSKQELFRVAGGGFDQALSPVVIYDNALKKYKIWVATQEGTNRFLKHYESTTGVSWVFVRNIKIDTDDNVYRIWHFDIIYTDGVYEFVGSYSYQVEFDHKNFIFYAKSTDNVTYSRPQKILATGYAGRFDDQELYRPSLVRLPDSLLLFYGAQQNMRKWSIGLIQTPNIDSLANLFLSAEKINELESMVESSALSIQDLYAKLDKISGGTGEPPNYGGVVSNGLICWLDGADKTNTSENKNTWYDKSGNLNHANLNGFTYSAASGWTGTKLKTDGLKDYIDVTALGTIAIQLDVVFTKTITDEFNPGYLFDGRPGALNSYAVFTTNSDDLGSYWSKLYVDGANKGITQTTQLLQEVPHGVLTNVYLEGKTAINTVMRLMAGNFGSDFMGAEIKSVKFYNRPLTDSEISQNNVAGKK